MANRASRLVTGTFIIYETDGPDAGNEPDPRPLVGLVLQFTPRQQITAEVGPNRVAYIAPIFGITDSQGRITSPDGSLGVRVPTSMPEGFTYDVRVIPPDGSYALPYTFYTVIPAGDETWDISSLPALNIGSLPTLGTVRVQLEDPRVTDPNYVGWWLQSTVGDPETGVQTGSGELILIY